MYPNYREYNRFSENFRRQPLPTEVYNGYGVGEEVDSGINAYEEEEEEDDEVLRGQRQAFFASPMDEDFEKDVYSPYVGGMDVRLAQFVSQHNVNMDDGAVIHPMSVGETTAVKTKSFKPPCGCTERQFYWALGGVAVAIVAVLAVAVTLGVLFGQATSLRFPEATPWWTHGLVYQINVPTFANDVGGSLGRLKDVTPRMAYIADKLHATAAILTGVLDADKNGVLNWRGIGQEINGEGDSVESLLAGLNSAASEKKISLMLGMPLYATSERHPWFMQSVLMNPARFANFYLWRKEKPVNLIEARYYAFNSVRNEYYRHIHGNPASPMLNLSDTEVQTELKSVIAFWKKELGISGILVTNSTNLLSDMASALNSILSSGLDDANTFAWFADDPSADKLLTDKRLCYVELINNERITTRTEDIEAQLHPLLAEIKQRSCSPVWRLVQRSSDFTDYFSLQQFVSFLPGLSLLRAGEEVQLMTGTTELIAWHYEDQADFTTYWPDNVLPEETARRRLQQWARYLQQTVAVSGSIFNTGWNTNDVRILSIPRTENLFVVERGYLPNVQYKATFVVSFQALNAFVNLADVVSVPDGGSFVDLVYEKRGYFTGDRLRLDWTYLVNNDVFITFS